MLRGIRSMRELVWRYLKASEGDIHSRHYSCACRTQWREARLCAMKNLDFPHIANCRSFCCFNGFCSSLRAQDWAKTRLEASPRHREYVPLKHGNRTVQALVVYPESQRQSAGRDSDSRDLRLERLGQGDGRRTGRAGIHCGCAGSADRLRPQWRRLERVPRRMQR